jgi:hypothetical protein
MTPPASERFRLIAGVRRGSASNYPAAHKRYDTIEDARDGAAELLREERVWSVMIVRDDFEHAFVEWSSR